MDTQIDTILECVKKYSQSFYEFKLGEILESITDYEEKSAINYNQNTHLQKYLQFLID